MDAVTLDGTLAELRPLVVGRYLSKPRLAGGSAVAFDVQGSRDRWLWLDAGRGTAGVYWLPRDTARSLADRSPAAVPGRSRQALLHLRKHLDGARVVALARVAGERAVVLEAGDSRLALRLGGSAPALSLVRDGAVLGSLGEGPDAWPLPESPEREWDRLDPVVFEAAVAAARAEGRSLVRAVLAACPGLGPLLAREMDGSAASLVALRERLRDAAPLRLARPGRPPDTWHDADLADPAAVTLAPIAPAGGERTVLRPSSWLEAGALFLEARRRGLEFERRRRSALDEARRQIRRLEQLEANLAQDLAGLADEGDLRRRAGALLAFARGAEAGRESVELPDPHDPGARARRRARSPPRGPRQRGAAVRQGAARRAGAPPDRPATARDAVGASLGARGARRSCWTRATRASCPGARTTRARGTAGTPAPGPATT